MGLGLLSSFTEIFLNGGMMPIQPEVVQKLIPGASTGLWAVGARFLMTKDMVLPLASTRLWFLDECLIVPSWMTIPPRSVLAMY